MKILFVSASDPATNPRIVKEMQFAQAEGHELQLVYFGSDNWSKQASDDILSKINDVVSYRIDKSWWPCKYKVGQAIRDLIRILGFPVHFGLKFKSVAHSERSWYLNRILSKLAWQADLVIGHQLASFWPAAQYAKKNGALLGLDIEDYHPGERFPIGFKMRNEGFIRRKLITKLLPQADYTTYAAPLIREECLAVCGAALRSETAVTINNSFWLNEFSHPANANSQEGPIRLMWFSQNINSGRGLEEVVDALQSIDFKGFTLHIYGKLNPGFYKDYLQNHANHIQINEPVSQLELHHAMTGMDIGLSPDHPKADHNRTLALPNKIWAFLQSGLYILSSNTPAQVQLMAELPEHGLCSQLTREDLVENLLRIQKNIVQIRTNQGVRRKAMEKMAFEQETTKLRLLWKVINH